MYRFEDENHNQLFIPNKYINAKKNPAVNDAFQMPSLREIDQKQWFSSKSFWNNMLKNEGYPFGNRDFPKEILNRLYEEYPNLNPEEIPNVIKTQALNFSLRYDYSEGLGRDMILEALCFRQFERDCKRIDDSNPFHIKDSLWISNEGTVLIDSPAIC